MTATSISLMILQFLTVLRLFPKGGWSKTTRPIKADWISCQEGAVLCRFLEGF
jgi:hypothetical protein